jgi:hypothetical protein
MRRGLTLVVLLAAGCGGGGADELTRDEYVQKVAESCERMLAETRSLDPPDSYQGEDFAEFLEESEGIRKGFISELRELDPPESLQADVNRWLALLERHLVTSRQSFGAVERGDRKEVEKLRDESKRNAEEAQALARKIGLLPCGASEGTD